MKLIDDVKIIVKAGDGGDGATSRMQMFGSKKVVPDGGNGGNGGSVYFKVDNNLSDLSEFTFKKKVEGISGINGGKKDKDGRNGEDITILVPNGTTIYNLTTNDEVEIIDGQSYLIAKGGHGGLGNHDYKPDLKNFNPRISEGQKGEEFEIRLVMNMIADIGLVGYPNAGKSSLLSALTNANPKIGDYAFTTLTPNLGVLKNKVIADIPGLIEGASSGKGLGFSFLKHIKKTTTLLHLIDATDSDPLTSYKNVRSEFENFDQELLDKNEVIILTKIDLVESSKLDEIKKKLKTTKKQIEAVSVYDQASIDKLKSLILTL